MKLKTLKDLDFVDCGKFASNSLIKYKIKAEAIKWVKDAMNKDPDNWYIRCEVMLIFHNITEEDLSQGMTQEVPK